MLKLQTAGSKQHICIYLEWYCDPSPGWVRWRLCATCFNMGQTLSTYFAHRNFVGMLLLIPVVLNFPASHTKRG